MGGGNSDITTIDETGACPSDDCPLARLDAAPRSGGYVGRHRAPRAVPATAESASADAPLAEWTKSGKEPAISASGRRSAKGTRPASARNHLVAVDKQR